MQGVVEEKNRNDEYNGNGDFPPGQRKGGGERRTVQGCQIQDLNQVDLPDPIAVEIECLRKRVMELEKILQTTHKIEAGCIDCAGSSNLEETLIDVIREKNRKEGNENEDL